MTRFAILALALVVALVPLAGCGNRGEEKLYTIGVFQFSSNAVLERTVEGFLQAMTDAGYKDGENVRYQFENAQGDIPTTQLIARKLVSEVDLIFVVSTPALQAAINEVEEIPIVFGAVANPYIIGAGESAGEHLPNVTGASSTAPMRQTMELMLEALPDTKRVGVMWDPANANTHYEMEVAREVAAELGLKIVEVTISGSSEVLQGAQSLSTKDIDAFFTILDNVVMDAFDSLAKVADQTHIPLIAPATGLAEQGAAIGVGWDYFDNGYLAGQLVVRVMKGEDPASIPFEPLAKKLIYVNPAAAERQGFTLPPSLLERADKIVEEAK
jgi:putative ABC transport system substrate-binding protein